MICKICKKKEATQHQGKMYICDECLIELQLSVRFYIGKKEVSPEEYYRRINETK